MKMRDVLESTSSISFCTHERGEIMSLRESMEHLAGLARGGIITLIAQKRAGRWGSFKINVHGHSDFFSYF